MYIKKFDQWNILKKEINNRSIKRFIKEREIWWCSIGINVGDEQDGKNRLFERPVVVLKRVNSELCLVAPMTSLKKKGFYYFPLSENEIVIISQIILVSIRRMSRKIRKVGYVKFDELLEDIIDKLFRVKRKNPRSFDQGA